MELQAAVALIRRRWWVVGLAFLLGITAAGIYSSSKPKVYRSVARLYISVPNLGDVKQATDAVSLTQQLITTYAKVTDSEVTTKLVADALDNKVTPAQVRNAVDAAAVPRTTLLEISARNKNPALAANLANATANALTDVIEQLGQLSTGNGVKATVVDEAHVPFRAILPKPKQDVATGGVLGLALGAVLALVLDALDRTIRDSSVASAAFDAPLLCSIPKQRRLSSDPLVALKSGGSPTGEAYRALRTAVRFRDAAHPLRTVLVTSAAAGDGKSTIAANLAIAMSLDGARVILIDADLRRTTLANMFGLKQGPGLTNVLMGKATLTEALVSWSRGLSVLQVGTQSLNPSEALGSTAMVEVLNEAKEIADIVIVDAPPVLPVADPAVLAALVDGTVVVSRWGKTSPHAAEATRQMLDNVGANVIGVVFNAEGGGRSANYYRHYSSRRQHRRTGNGTNGVAPSPRGAPSASAADGS